MSELFWPRPLGNLTTPERETAIVKSTLGMALGVGVLLAFAMAWRLATRENSGFLDQQWLLFTALPYNLAVVSLFGESNFSPDVPAQVIAAALCEAAAAYFAGALAQVSARWLWRRARR